MYYFFFFLQKVGHVASLILTILKKYSLIWDGTEMLNFFLKAENIRKYFEKLKDPVKIEFVIFFKSKNRKAQIKDLLWK